MLRNLEVGTVVALIFIVFKCQMFKCFKGTQCPAVGLLHLVTSARGAHLLPADLHDITDKYIQETA